MWTATYECHEFDRLVYSSRVDSCSFWRAWIWYQFWGVCYILTRFPVKQVSLYRHENGITFMRGYEGKSQNHDILRSLRWDHLQKSRQL